MWYSQNNDDPYCHDQKVSLAVGTNKIILIKHIFQPNYIYAQGCFRAKMKIHQLHQSEFTFKTRWNQISDLGKPREISSRDYSSLAVLHDARCNFAALFLLRVKVHKDCLPSKRVLVAFPSCTTTFERECNNGVKAEKREMPVGRLALAAKQTKWDATRNFIRSSGAVDEVSRMKDE